MEWIKEDIEKLDKNIYIYIPGNVPSSKNSRMWTGKISVASKSVQKWRRSTKEIWISEKEHFKKKIKNLPKPYFIGMYFIKSTKHRWDFVNPVQTIQDEMVKYEWIEDDDVKNIYPIPITINNTLCGTSKECAGVIIKIIKEYNIW